MGLVFASFAGLFSHVLVTTSNHFCVQYDFCANAIGLVRIPRQDGYGLGICHYQLSCFCRQLVIRFYFDGNIASRNVSKSVT